MIEHSKLYSVKLMYQVFYDCAKLFFAFQDMSDTGFLVLGAVLAGLRLDFTFQYTFPKT